MGIFCGLDKGNVKQYANIIWNHNGIVYRFKFNRNKYEKKGLFQVYFNFKLDNYILKIIKCL